MTESYAAQVPGLLEHLKTLVPSELLDLFGGEAEALGLVDFAARAVKAGDTAPAFTLPDQTGRKVSLAESLARGSVVLTFYRGGWCPYCNLQLRSYQQSLGEFRALGAQLIAISPQTPDHSLSTAEKNELEFSVLSDEGNTTARAFGLLFEVDEAMRETYLQVGSDPLAYNGGDRRSWELPAPATYVINPDGRILFAQVHGDYRRRTEPAEIIQALR
ncbi:MULTISPECIES: peroxiredoxin-like family protein [unclassified Streptomyces]|nr:MULTISPECIES: peroxiredoxin-like family protein [unclassified Streptomyces]MCM1971281.1 AhpC/TSA family protein [Streptomyces sp. G1]QNE26196.1 AhpC/TSA family protein [Streptomyces sp. INR7]